MWLYLYGLGCQNAKNIYFKMLNNPSLLNSTLSLLYKYANTFVIGLEERQLITDIPNDSIGSSKCRNSTRYMHFFFLNKLFTSSTRFAFLALLVGYHVTCIQIGLATWTFSLLSPKSYEFLKKKKKIQYRYSIKNSNDVMLLLTTFLSLPVDLAFPVMELLKLLVCTPRSLLTSISCCFGLIGVGSRESMNIKSNSVSSSVLPAECIMIPSITTRDGLVE